VGASVLPTLENIPNGIGNLLPGDGFTFNDLKKCESIFGLLTATGSESTRWNSKWAEMRLV
jgi:hypothetical protein